MADDLSLLFKLRADNAQAKAALAETQAVILKLRASFGSDFDQMQKTGQSALSAIGDSVSDLAGRTPLLGEVVEGISRVVEKAKTLTNEMRRGGPETKKLADQIDALSKTTGKSKDEVAKFLTSFIRLKDASARNEAAFKAFGGSVDVIGNKTAKLLPQLEEAGKSLTTVAESGEAAGSSIIAIAGPIGIAVIALGALVLGAVEATKELIELTKQSAEFQGRMADLAQQTGLEVETLSALEIAARTAGGEIGSITQAIVNFQRKLDDAQDPLSKTSEQFRKFAIDTSDTENALRQTFAALARMPTGFAQTNAAAEFFGARGGKQVLAILKETNGNLDDTIERFRDLGIIISDDDARSAKKLNDELVLLDFQFKNAQAALVRELIPALADMARETGDVIRSMRPLISLLATATKPAVFTASEAFKGLSLTIRVLTGDYKALAEAAKEADDARDIKPLKVPDLAPVPLPGAASPQQAAADAVNQADAVAAAVRRKVAEQNQALNSLFEQGRTDRQKQTNEIIDLNRQQLKADQDRIDALLSQKEQEIKALDEAQRNRGEIIKRDTEDYRAISAQVQKLQQDRLDKQSEFDVQLKALQAKAAKERADSLRNQAKNENDLLVNELDRQIKNIEASIKEGTTAEETGLTVIEQLEQAKIDAQIASVEKQKEIGFLTVENQKDLDNQLKQLQQQKDRLGDEQTNRRIERERATAERTRDIKIGEIETALRLEQIAGERTIATVQALADARVITEEQAARKIRDIRLKLIDDEIEATQAKLKAAGSIADKDERVRTEADLNNQLKVLKEERVSLEVETDRAISDAQRKDIENERSYADELKQIWAQIRDIRRDAAKTIIDLMVLHHARRRDIIRAEAALDIQDENDRHQRELDSIAKQKQENVESKKTAEEKLEVERELNQESEAEAERHRLELEKIEQRRKDAERDRQGIFVPGSILPNVDEGADRFKAVTEGIKAALADLKQVGLDAFSSLAQGIGNLVSNYVLLGTTGPAALRKLLAATLAQIAAESAVRAIYWTAQGIVDLFFNPARAAADFAGAALFASIAGVSALAGRAVAGNLFKQPGTSSGSGTGTSNQQGQLNPLNLERNTGQREIVVKLLLEQHVKSNDSHIVETIVKDFQSGGNTREVINSDGVLV